MAALRTPPRTANAVLGNGHLLATFDHAGALQQLWWPHVDRDPHLELLRVGGVAGDGAIRWLDGLDAQQRYEPGATVLSTVLTGDDGDLTLTDVVPVESPVLVRRIEGPWDRLLVHVRPAIGGTGRSGGAYVYDDILVFYRGTQVMAVGTDMAAAAGVRRVEDQESIGAILAYSWTNRTAFGRVEGALLARPVSGSATVVIAMAESRESAVALVREALAVGLEPVVGQRRLADGRRLTTPHSSLSGPAADLDLRSQLVLEMLTDKVTGGVIAAPECDPDFTISGGYGYVWPRDLAFIVLALLAAERSDLARPALSWLADAQSPDGLWLQRHWTDGNLAPSWGTQLDETGSVLFAYEQAWQQMHDEPLDRQLWPSAAAAADALVRAIDPQSGLPAASRDLWEERLGVHTFTSAAVCAGLRAAAQMALRHDPSRGAHWQQTSDRLLEAIDERLWCSETGRYVRAVDVARDDGQGKPTPPGYRLSDHPEQTPRSVDVHDDTVDVSLLGLVYPFRLKAADDPRMASTIAAIEQQLGTPDGGLLRYADDRYAGGNPWVLARLWLGLARRTAGASSPADGIDYAVACATDTELLPEQVDARTGRPAWVVPLAWSHAMLLLASRSDHLVVVEPEVAAVVAG